MNGKQPPFIIMIEILPETNYKNFAKTLEQVCFILPTKNIVHLKQHKIAHVFVYKTTTV